VPRNTGSLLTYALIPKPGTPEHLQGKSIMGRGILCTVHKITQRTQRTVQCSTESAEYTHPFEEIGVELRSVEKGHRLLCRDAPVIVCKGT